MDPWFTRLLCLIISSYALFLGGLGVYLLIFARSHQSKDMVYRSWPKSKGIITLNKIKTENDEQGRTSFIPTVQFIYLADHHFYQGDRIFVGDPPRFTKRRKAENILDQFPLGCQVSVFYDPLKPQNAILEHATFATSHCVILGVIFITMMIILLSLMSFWWIFGSPHILNPFIL